ncbi:MAG: hypothetical protein AMXMBFR58_24540 [Phycisphaerae bacterium]
MTGELLVVVGLPGSGKTEYMKTLASAVTGCVADDYMKDSLGGSEFTMSRSRRLVVEALRTGKNCIVSDIELCRPHRRAEFEQTMRADVPSLLIRWVFFRNDPAACTQNVICRARPQMIEELRKIQELAPQYQIPAGAIVRPVHGGS